MKKYFITIIDYTPVNILDQRLQKEMTDMFRHKVITESDVHKVRDAFTAICGQYKLDGGKAVMSFSLSVNDDERISYTVGSSNKTSMYIHLTAIRGNVE